MEGELHKKRTNREELYGEGTTQTKTPWTKTTKRGTTQMKN